MVYSKDQIRQTAFAQSQHHPVTKEERRFYLGIPSKEELKKLPEEK